jgi:hypothetical protein
MDFSPGFQKFLRNFIERSRTILYNNAMTREKNFIMVMLGSPGLCLSGA